MRYITSQKKFRNSANGRSGAILILSLLVLALITTMGVFAATRASVEQRIAGNSSAHMSTFYIAEAALHHAKEILIEDYGDYNVDEIALGNEAHWTWLLDGSVYASAATSYYCEGCDDVTGATQLTGAWISGGVTIMDRQVDIGNRTYTYTVTAWDNDEIHLYNSEYTDNQKNNNCPSWSPGNKDYYDALSPDTTSSPSRDCDQKIIIRAVARAWLLGDVSGASLAESIQEMTLGGIYKSGGGILSGLSQEFANEGKSSSGVDVNEITDFTKTIL